MRGKNQAPAVETLRRYVELRLHNADWKDYSTFVTWPDEPGWDCNWVVSKYNVRASKKEDDGIIVPVVYNRLGLFCYDFEFESDPRVVTIDYQLVKRPSGWKVNAPIPDYPDISAAVLIKSLSASAENSRESPERRAQYSATARQVADAVSHARVSSR